MKNLQLIIPVLFLGVFACGSGRKQLNPEEYILWMKRSQKELIRTKEINGYRFISKFQPADMLVLRNSEGISSQSSIDSMKNIQKGILNFVIDIGSVDNTNSLLRANISGENEYYSRVYYYTSEVQNDLFVVEGNDTLPCVFYHFEQTYNLSPVNSLVMEFERRITDEHYEDITLIYRDRILNTGTIKFQYKKSFLNNLPQLTLL